MVAGFVVAGGGGAGAGLRDDYAAAVDEADDRGLVENVLIEAGEEEDAVAAERTSEGEAELLLLAGRFHIEEWIAGVEGAVAEVIEPGAVKFVRAGLGDDVDDGAAGASGFGGDGIGGDAEFLDHLVGKLIGGAIAAAGLGEEGVVVVGAIDEVTGLEAADAAEGEVAVGSGVEAAGVLGDAGGEQGEVGEAAAVQRKIEDGAFIND